MSFDRVNFKQWDGNADQGKLLDFTSKHRPLYPTRTSTTADGSLLALRGYLMNTHASTLEKVQFSNEWEMVPSSDKLLAVGIKGNDLYALTHKGDYIKVSDLPSGASLGQNEGGCTDDGKLIVVTWGKRYIALYSTGGTIAWEMDVTAIRSGTLTRGSVSPTGRFVVFGIKDSNSSRAYIHDRETKRTTEMYGDGFRFGGGSHGRFGYLEDGKTEIYISEGNSGAGRIGKIQFIRCHEPKQVIYVDAFPEIPVGTKIGGHISRAATKHGLYMFCCQAERTGITSVITFIIDANGKMTRKAFWGNTGNNVLDSYEDEAKANISSNGEYCVYIRARLSQRDIHIAKFTGDPKYIGADEPATPPPPPPPPEEPNSNKLVPTYMFSKRSRNGDHVYIDLLEASKAGRDRIVVAGRTSRTVLDIDDLLLDGAETVRITVV